MAARAGDQREFSGLTEPYRHELQLHCYRILGSLQDAEDIVQETLLRAYQNLPRLRDPAKFKPWVHLITLNLCRDRMRSPLPSRASP